MTKELALEAIEKALRNVPLLSGLSQDVLQPLAERVELRTYAPGATIVAQDETGQTLFIILAGRVRVERRGRRGVGATHLAELGSGEFFGEMALLEHRPRSADVVATTETTCALLGYEVFREHVIGNPDVSTALLVTLSRRLRALEELMERPRVETKASPRERERRVLQQGETAMASDIRDALVIKELNHFTLFDPEGNIPIANTAGFGLYLGDTRHLSGYEVSLGRVQGVPLVSTAHLGYAADQQLTNRDIRLGRRTIRKQTLLISRERLANEAGFDEQITISNFNRVPVEVAVQIRFAADFADIFEVRGVGSARRGQRQPADVNGDSVTLAYEGRDKRVYETRLTFDPPPTRLRARGAAYRAHVDGLGSTSIRVRITASVRGADQPAPTNGADPVLADACHRTALAESYRAWSDAATAFDSDNAIFDAAIDRSLSDLRLLVNDLDGQRYFAAGIPWFATLFGRDSLITGLQTLAWNPALSAGILRLLARYQGAKDDPWRDEEPGKILHELRSGEFARIQQIPHTPYYGTIDATPLFLMLADAYYAWTGDLELLHALRPNLEAAERWCREYGDLDGDGYVEYARRSAKGLANQGWKDSGEGTVFHNGRLPAPPIALVEVQAYVYAAYRGLARVLRALEPDDDARPRALEQRAELLKQRFNQDFWMPGPSFYALALDGKRRQVDAVTSNPGHALWTGIVAQDRAPAVAARLLSDELFSGWGIRTLSSASATYNPLGYHLGTVWPHDNALIVAGLRRYGFDDEAVRVLDAQFDAAQHFPDYRLPELFSGIARTGYGVPIGYPIACSPQAWAAGSLPFMLGQVLGLRPRAGRVLEIVRPVLPSALERVRLRGLRVGGSRLDLTFERSGQPGHPTRVVVDRGSDVVVYADGPLTRA